MVRLLVMVNIHEAKTHLSKLLDTQIAIWWLIKPEAITETTQALVHHPACGSEHRVVICHARHVAAGGIELRSRLPVTRITSRR